MFFGIDFIKLALNPKTWLYILILGVLGWAGFKGYNWIYDRGAASRDAEVSKLAGERDEAKRNYDTYKGEYDEWVRTTKTAQEQYLREQLADLEARQARLAQAERDARNKPTTIKEVIRYVPAEVDATFKLPVGFIRLYSESIQGGSASADPFSGLSQGLLLDAGETSGIALSQFGQIAASNNAECVLRGKVIDEWQGWYQINSSFFEKIRKWQEENGPKAIEGAGMQLPPPPANIQ